MPRKAKFSQKDVISAAVEITEQSGFKSLTARSLGEKLESSSRPVFTAFKNMEEVCSGVKDRAEEIYKSYIESGLKETPSFKGVGKAYIRFASERPQLFRLLFMRENGEIPSLDSVLGKIDGNFAKILNSITANYPVGSETALNIYKHLWIYSHGIAVLTVTKVCAFGENEISEMLTEVFKSLLKNSIGEKND